MASGSVLPPRGRLRSPRRLHGDLPCVAKQVLLVRATTKTKGPHSPSPRGARNSSHTPAGGFGARNLQPPHPQPERHRRYFSCPLTTPGTNLGPAPSARCARTIPSLVITSSHPTTLMLDQMLMGMLRGRHGLSTDARVEAPPPHGGAARPPWTIYGCQF